MLCDSRLLRSQIFIEMEEYTFSYIDVTETAVGTGFGIYGCPVGIEPAVWEECVEWTDEDSKIQGYQDQDARLWDILFVGGAKLKMQPNEILLNERVDFQIHCIIRYTSDTESTPTKFSIEKALLKGTPGLIIRYSEDEIKNRKLEVVANE